MTEIKDIIFKKREIVLLMAKEKVGKTMFGKRKPRGITTGG